MTWLLLDAGNTALKWALAEAGEFRTAAQGILGLDAGFGDLLVEALREPMTARPAVPPFDLRAIGCSVASDATAGQIVAALRRLVPAGVQWLASQAQFDYQDVLLTNGYRDPAQLGADRWHAMIAARHSFPEHPLVVVCAGTATTVDSVDPAGRFLGGAIAPGTSIMAEGLARGTARLPRSVGRPVQMPDNTDDAIATGVADALAGLVERRVRAMARAGAPPQLVMAGGRVRELAARLSVDREVAGITIEEHLVLRGLWIRASAEQAAVESRPRPVQSGGRHAQ